MVQVAAGGLPGPRALVGGGRTTDQDCRRLALRPRDAGAPLLPPPRQPPLTGCGSPRRAFNRRRSAGRRAGRRVAPRGD
jgi:hypothetical protein